MVGADRRVENRRDDNRSDTIRGRRPMNAIPVASGNCAFLKR